MEAQPLTFHTTHIDKIYAHCSLIMRNKIIIWLLYFPTYKSLWRIKYQSFHNLIPIFMFFILGYHLNDLLITTQPLSPTTLFLDSFLFLSITLIWQFKCQSNDQILFCSLVTPCNLSLNINLTWHLSNPNKSVTPCNMIIDDQRSFSTLWLLHAIFQ
jgi:hypothetical protein